MLYIDGVLLLSLTIVQKMILTNNKYIVSDSLL